MNLFLVEARRALHRRVVWALLALALAGTVIAAIAVFVASSDLDPARLRAEGQHHAAVMADWWVPGTGDGLLAIAAIFLVVGGIIGGATVVGGEWRAGTVGTLLTWEARRDRLHAARLGACAAVAFLLALALQVVFLAAFLPAVAAHGTTAGVDGSWTVGLMAAMARVAAMTALATVLGGAVATMGRATAAGLIGVGGWLAVGEGLVRAWRPGMAQHLLGENATVLLTWSGLDGDVGTRGPGMALLTLVAYALVAVTVASVEFRRRDVTAA